MWQLSIRLLQCRLLCGFELQMDLHGLHLLVAIYFLLIYLFKKLLSSHLLLLFATEETSQPFVIGSYRPNVLPYFIVIICRYKYHIIDDNKITLEWGTMQTGPLFCCFASPPPSSTGHEHLSLMNPARRQSMEQWTVLYHIRFMMCIFV